MTGGLVIKGGRVLDLASSPEGDLRDLVIRDGRITEDATGRERILDVSGVLVLPGFVDVHTHLAPSWGGRLGWPMTVRAGSTFALDVTGPSHEVRAAHRAARVRLRVGVCDAVTMASVGRSLRDARAAVVDALAKGAVGVKILGGHFPLTPRATRNVIAACAERGCLCVVHVGTTRTYSDIEGLDEALALADGAPVHIAHVNGYCRGYHGSPIEEASIALGLLRQHPSATSDSYVFRWNALPLERDGPRLTSNATRFWLRKLGYLESLEGVFRAWADGRARLIVPQRGEHVLLGYVEAGESPRRHLGNAMYLSLPVNPVEAAVAVAGARGADGAFVVDCLSTDGGGIPRNVLVSVAWHFVRIGVWSWHDVIEKTSAAPARLVHLPERGALRPGAPAELTLIDEATGRTAGSIVAGRPALWAGEVQRARPAESERLYHHPHSRPQPAGGMLP